MGKSYLFALYIFTLVSAGLIVNKAFAQRSPSVEPITEISIEEDRVEPKTGFDFLPKTAQMKVEKQSPRRVPANIVTKTSSTSYSFIGPLIFLIALPLALWIVVSRKMKNTESEKKVDYYGKTYQFKPYKSEYQTTDDDEQFPKAS